MSLCKKRCRISKRKNKRVILTWKPGINLMVFTWGTLIFYPLKLLIESMSKFKNECTNSMTCTFPTQYEKIINIAIPKSTAKIHRLLSNLHESLPTIKAHFHTFSDSKNNRILEICLIKTYIYFKYIAPSSADINFTEEVKKSHSSTSVSYNQTTYIFSWWKITTFLRFVSKLENQITMKELLTDFFFDTR